MKTQCTENQMVFQDFGRRTVQVGFDGGHVSSDGGALLFREIDERLGIVRRFAQCFTDYRDPRLIEHSLESLLKQRLYGIGLGYDDLNDHDELLYDPLLALLSNREDIEGNNRHRASDKGKVLASSSTLNRMELTCADACKDSRYKKIVYHEELIEKLLVDLFLDSFIDPPEEIILDFDATDDPLYGNQEGRFYHGYYDCYCYLPLYVTCGDHILVSKLRQSDIDASSGSVEILEMLVGRIRACWPNVHIIMRADSGFARDAIMTWCENNQVSYILGLAKNKRLLDRIIKQHDDAHIRHILTGAAARVFTTFFYRTADSWSAERRVVGKAEYLRKGYNPRFIVTNLPEDYAGYQDLYEKVYCARGDMENRIKEQQLDLFSDRTSCHTMRANQLRLWFSTIAYTLISSIRRIGLKDTSLAKATCGTIRLKIFKIGALVKVSVRRFWVHLSSACPYQDIFQKALENILAYPMRL